MALPARPAQLVQAAVIAGPGVGVARRSGRRRPRALGRRARPRPRSRRGTRAATSDGSAPSARAVAGLGVVRQERWRAARRAGSRGVHAGHPARISGAMLAIDGGRNCVVVTGVACQRMTECVFAIGGGPARSTRLGYGAMQITGPGIWGRARRTGTRRSAVLRRAPSSGVDFIDTADSYGPVRQRGADPRGAAPLRRRSTIATKGGLTRTGPGEWQPVGRPGVPPPGVRDEPAPASAWSASTCSSCTASTRRSRSPTRSASCSDAAGRGQDPPHRAVRGQRRRDRRGPA